MALIAALASVAIATPCQDQDEATARSARRLQDQHDKASTWNWTWGSIFGAAVVSQVAVAQAIDDEDLQFSLYMGASKALLGVGAQIVTPMRVPGPSERCDELPSLLREAREREHRKRWGWFTHTSTIGLNVAGLLAVGLYTDNWTLATLGSLSGAAVGYLSVFTAPSAFLDDDGAEGHAALTPMIRSDGGGLMLSGRF